LEAANDGTGSAGAECRHLRAAGERSPRQWPDNAIDSQAGTLLKLLDGSVNRCPEYAVDDQSEVGSSVQRPLQPANGITGRSERDRWLIWIWHAYPLCNGFRITVVGSLLTQTLCLRHC
jgi:hypothetical protein